MFSCSCKPNLQSIHFSKPTYRHEVWDKAHMCVLRIERLLLMCVLCAVFVCGAALLVWLTQGIRRQRRRLLVVVVKLGTWEGRISGGDRCERLQNACYMLQNS